MTKTLNAVSPRRAKLEMVVSAAMVSALASLSTAETIDLSSVFKGAEGGNLQRNLAKEYVTGDSEAIQEYDTSIMYDPITFSFLYTNGKDQLGTDNIDLYTVLKEIAEYTASELSPQFIYSPAGGAIGDQEFSTDATETRITGLTGPSGQVDAGAKIQCTVTVDTPSYTPATVT